MSRMKESLHVSDFACTSVVEAVIRVGEVGGASEFWEEHGSVHGGRRWLEEMQASYRRHFSVAMKWCHDMGICICCFRLINR